MAGSGMNASNVIIPGRGAVFLADPGTDAPNYKTISPDNLPAGWASLGHTSKDNAVSLSTDGGDATTYDSWWTAAIAVTYDAKTWSVTANALEISQATLDLAFGGELETDSETGGYVVPSEVVAVDKALFVLAMQGTKRMGLYLPKTSVTLGDAPTFSPDALFEIPLSAQVLADDVKGLMEWFHPALDKAAV